MNPIQLKLEQVFKEYIAFKDIIESDKRTLDDLRKEVAQKTLSGEDEIKASFEIFGEKELKSRDFRQIGIKLYYFCEALKDLVEIPQQILDVFEKIEVKQTFALVNSNLEIADKEFYDLTKKQFTDAVLAEKSRKEE